MRLEKTPPPTAQCLTAYTRRKCERKRVLFVVARALLGRY
jgi:hypothetical protein